MDGRDVKLLVALLVIVAVLGTWYFRDRLLPRPEQPAIALPAPDPVEPERPEGPAHPIELVEAGVTETGGLVTLPPLDDSDAYFLLALVDIFGADVEPLLVKDALIDRIVTTVDNLPRGHVAEKVRPVGRLTEPFRTQTGSSDEVYQDPGSYQRYTPLVSVIAAANVDDIVESYRRFYPLFQESYERLGYPDSYFNDRVIEVIDHLLETPQPAEPPQLIRPHVLYEFADQDLENLSSGQKLLLRMGTEHAQVIKRVLVKLRAALAQPSTD
jgi:hypothetical protein